MFTTEITVVFEGPAADAGVSVADLNEVLKRLQTAVRLMASHLAGVGMTGRPPEWLRGQIALRLQSVFPGSFGAVLALPEPDFPTAAGGYGVRALDAILDWDENHSRLLPPQVVDSVNAIGRNLSPEVRQVRLGDRASGRQVVIKRTGRRRGPPHPVAPPAAVPAEASLYGRLLEINWQDGTAQLHRYGEAVVPLRFEAGLNETMRELATRYVAVRGEGRITARDEWAIVAVREVVAEPSEIDAFYARPGRAFDPQQAVSFYRDDADDPVDIDEFIRIVHEGRDL